TRTRSVTEGPPLTAMTSSRTGQGMKVSPWRTLWPPTPNSSRNRSVLSTSPAVSPQAAWALWATRNPGPPTKVAPATAPGGGRAAGGYGGAGGRAWGGGRWAGRGRRGAVRLFASAQLLEPPPGLTTARKAATSSASRSTAAPAAWPGGAGTGCQAG